MTTSATRRKFTVIYPDGGSRTVKATSALQAIINRYRMLGRFGDMHVQTTSKDEYSHLVSNANST